MLGSGSQQLWTRVARVPLASMHIATSGRFPPSMAKRTAVSLFISEKGGFSVNICRYNFYDEKERVTSDGPPR